MPGMLRSLNNIVNYIDCQANQLKIQCLALQLSLSDHLWCARNRYKSAQHYYFYTFTTILNSTLATAQTCSSFQVIRQAGGKSSFHQGS